MEKCHPHLKHLVRLYTPFLSVSCCLPVTHADKCLSCSVPRDAETHFIEIRFNGEQIPNSPFVVRCIDASKMTIQRESLDRIPVNKEASFDVNTNGSSFSQHFVSISAPGGRTVLPTVTGSPDDGYKVTFTPTQVGDHVIDVKAADGGDSVPPCPFVVKVYDARNVKVSDMNAGAVGKAVFFTSKFLWHENKH